MFMDLLEQEVESLSAEVTRLRIMLHRVTQVMEVPPPPPPSSALYRGGYEGSKWAPPWGTAGLQYGAANQLESEAQRIQPLLESYKQVLPLVQLLLEQQSLQKQKPAKSKGSSSQHRRRRDRRRRSSRRRQSSSESSVSSASSSQSSRQSTQTSNRSAAVAVTTTMPSKTSVRTSPEAISLPLQHEKERANSKVEIVTPTHGPVTELKTEHPVLATPTTVNPTVSTVAASNNKRQSISPPLPTSAPQHSPPTPSPFLDRLRAKREQDEKEEDDDDDSLDRHPCVSKKMVFAAPQSLVAPSEHVVAHRRASRSLVSGSIRATWPDPTLGERGKQPPSESREQHSRSALMTSDHVPEATETSDASPPGKDTGVSPSHRASVFGSMDFSQQGIYSYSALPSVFNSPSFSHLPIAASNSHATTVVSEAADIKQFQSQPTPASANERRWKDEMSSPLASPSSSRAKPGIILGARQPIVIPDSSSSTPASQQRSGVALGTTTTKQRGSFLSHLVAQHSMTSSSSSYVTPSAGREFANVGAENSSNSSSSSSSDSDTMDERLPLPASSMRENHESSLRELAGTSDINRSQLMSGGTLSRDAYSLALYTPQFSPPASPSQRDLSLQQSQRAASQSPVLKRSALNTSQISSIPRGRSIGAGGYYYGDDMGLDASRSRQSHISSTPAADAPSWLPQRSNESAGDLFSYEY